MSNIKQFFDREDVKTKFSAMLGKRAPQFITSVLQIATSNKLLENADPLSIYNSAAIAATLDLPLNNNLGFAWIVPYKKNFKDAQGNWQSVVLAQFQIGYRGFIQLAQRTGNYQRINVTEVFANQFKKWNALTEELDADFSIDGTGEVVGFCCYFRLHNGFEKVSYWTIEKVRKHAERYSKSFGDGPWKTEFDKMAKKTVLKNTLSIWGILSIEMQTAIKADQSVINDAEAIDVTHIDGLSQPVNKEEERVALMISDAKTIEDLDKIYEHVPDSLMDTFLLKKQELYQPLNGELKEFDASIKYKKGDKFKYQGKEVIVESDTQYQGGKK